MPHPNLARRSGFAIRNRTPWRFSDGPRIPRFYCVGHRRGTKPYSTNTRSAGTPTPAGCPSDPTNIGTALANSDRVDIRLDDYSIGQLRQFFEILRRLNQS